MSVIGGISPYTSAHLFFCFAFFCNSRTPPAAACCSCKLDISGFRKSLVIHAHRARPDCRLARDCEANYFQCAEINGDMPLPNNKSPRSKECPIRRTKKAFRPRTNNKSPRSKQHPMCRPKQRYAPHRLTTSSMKRFKTLCLTRTQIFFS